MVCDRVGLVKRIDEVCVWGGACGLVYHFVSFPTTRLLNASLGGKVMRHMEVNMLQVCMALETTFVEARRWFQNAEQPQASQMAKQQSIWFWRHGPTMLGEDPAVDVARLRAMKKKASQVGREEG